MKKNVGKLDKVIRFILAIAIIVLIWLNVLQGTLALILGILAGILIITSLVGFCPLYAIFKISTCKIQQ